MALTFQVSDIQTHFLTSTLGGFCQPECWGMRMACCALQLFSVSHDLRLGRQSSCRSALSQSRASGSPSIVLGMQGTGNYFEAIITKSLPPFLHIPQQQEGTVLSSRRYLILTDFSGNKALKYLGESGSKNLIA